MSLPCGDWAMRSMVGNSSTERRTCQSGESTVSKGTAAQPSLQTPALNESPSQWHWASRRIAPKVCDAPRFNFLKHEANKYTVTNVCFLVRNSRGEWPLEAPAGAAPAEGSRQEPSAQSRRAFYVRKSTLLFISPGERFSPSKPTKQIKKCQLLWW